MTTDTTSTTDDAGTAAESTEDEPAPRTDRKPKASGSASASASAKEGSRGSDRAKGSAPRTIAPRRAATPPSRPVAPRPAEGGTGPGRLPWVLAVLGLVGTIAFASLWLAGRSDDDAAGASGTDETAALQDAADGFAKALTNFDGASIDQDFDGIVARSTGDFRDEVDQFFSSDTRKQLKEAQASSRGEIRSSYVQGLDGDRGSVFVVLDQTIANNKSPQPKADTLRMELALRLVDGEWLVQQVNVLEAPSGGVTAPVAGATTTTPEAASPGD